MYINCFDITLVFVIVELHSFIEKYKNKNKIPRYRIMCVCVCVCLTHKYKNTHKKKIENKWCLWTIDLTDVYLLHKYYYIYYGGSRRG